MSDESTPESELQSTELEIVEFKIGNEYYAINVLNVREIIRANIGIVPVPEAHASISGMVNLRGKIIPVVSLAKHLHVDTEYDPTTSRIIIAELTNCQAGFWVSEVTRILRVARENIEFPTGLLNKDDSYTKGVAKIHDRVLLLLDFEKIASVINTSAIDATVTGSDDSEETDT